MADLLNEVVLETSRDGGKTWSPQRGRTVGNDGEYKTRIVWRRNGRFDRTTVLRFSTKLAKRVAIGQLTLGVIPGE